MARVDNTGGSGFTVDNGTGLVVRTKLNQVIAALSTLNQGSGEMSVGVAAYVPHIDGNTLKIRNAANNAFVSLGDVSLANLGHASLSVANTFTARATFSVTSSITLPSGTTAQRDGSPAVGMIRHNSETNTFEGYNNGAWGSLSGASGISNVVDDTSPQLGGNLDVLTREITTSTTNGNIKLNSNGTGAIELFHNNAKKVETTTTGLSVTGNINLPDSTSNTIGRIMLGDGTDMQIQHDGGGGFIGNFTGNLTVHSNALRFMNGSKSENFLVANQNSSVDLYYDNANKFKTASYGVEIRGDGSSANGKIQLNCSQNSHGVKLESPDHSASQSYTIKLPDNQIAADKVLKVKSISGSGATAIGQLEFADAGGAGATGGGTDQAFFEGDQNVTTSYTLTANKNAMAISPTIDSGATITVPSGAILVIL